MHGLMPGLGKDVVAGDLSLTPLGRMSGTMSGLGKDVVTDDRSLTPIRRMRGSTSGLGKNSSSFTARKSHQKSMKAMISKNGGKKMMGMGRGKSLLTFVRKVSKSAYLDMNPKEKVKFLLRLFEKFLHNSSGKSKQWDTVRRVRELYPQYVPPTSGNSRIGSIPGVEIGDTFCSRAVLSLVGLHHRPQAGIDYFEYVDPKDGAPMLLAVSVVVSGMYEDDQDEGEQLIYTGEGGNYLEGRRKQYKDQVVEGGNLALVHSRTHRLPVRVIRARLADINNASSPTVYSYDGLYDVDRWKLEAGISKFKVCKFLLTRRSGQAPLQWFKDPRRL